MAHRWCSYDWLIKERNLLNPTNALYAIPTASPLRRLVHCNLWCLQWQKTVRTTVTPDRMHRLMYSWLSQTSRAKITAAAGGYRH